MKKMALLTVIFLSLCFSVQSQNIFVHAGALMGHNNLKELSPDGFPHVGKRLGLDLSVNKGNIYLLVGGQYMKYEFNPTIEKKGLDFNSPHQEMKARLGVGVNIVSIPKIFKLRVKAMGALHYADVDNTNIVIPSPYTELNKTYLGADFGVGINISVVTLDIEYEKGLSNVIDKTEDSKFNIWSMTAGLSF